MMPEKMALAKKERLESVIKMTELEYLSGREKFVDWQYFLKTEEEDEEEKKLHYVLEIQQT